MPMAVLLDTAQEFAQLEPLLMMEDLQLTEETKDLLELVQTEMLVQSMPLDLLLTLQQKPIKNKLLPFKLRLYVNKLLLLEILPTKIESKLTSHKEMLDPHNFFQMTFKIFNMLITNCLKYT